MHLSYRSLHQVCYLLLAILFSCEVYCRGEKHVFDRDVDEDSSIFNMDSNNDNIVTAGKLSLRDGYPIVLVENVVQQVKPSEKDKTTNKSQLNSGVTMSMMSASNKVKASMMAGTTNNMNMNYGNGMMMMTTTTTDASNPTNDKGVMMNNAGGMKTKMNGGMLMDRIRGTKMMMRNDNKTTRRDLQSESIHSSLRPNNHADRFLNTANNDMEMIGDDPVHQSNNETTSTTQLVFSYSIGADLSDPMVDVQDVFFLGDCMTVCPNVDEDSLGLVQDNIHQTTRTVTLDLPQFARTPYWSYVDETTALLNICYQIELYENGTFVNFDQSNVSLSVQLLETNANFAIAPLSLQRETNIIYRQVYLQYELDSFYCDQRHAPIPPPEMLRQGKAVYFCVQVAGQENNMDNAPAATAAVYVKNIWSVLLQQDGEEISMSPITNGKVVSATASLECHAGSCRVGVIPAANFFEKKEHPADLKLTGSVLLEFGGNPSRHYLQRHLGGGDARGSGVQQQEEEDIELDYFEVLLPHLQPAVQDDENIVHENNDETVPTVIHWPVFSLKSSSLLTAFLVVAWTVTLVFQIILARRAGLCCPINLSDSQNERICRVELEKADFERFPLVQQAAS